MKRDNRGSGRDALPVEMLERRLLASQAPWSPAMLDAEAHSGATFTQEHAAAVGAATHAVSASPQRAKPAAKVVNWDMATLMKMVKPLRRGLGGNTPMVLWSWPGPGGDIFVDQQNGTLRSFIDALAARGIVPEMPVGIDPKILLAFAQTLQDANLPVNLVIGRSDLIQGTAYQNTTVFGTYTDSAGQVYKYPCLPLADGSIGAAWVRDQLAPIQQAGIHVASVVFDDENLPHPWAPYVYESQKNDPTCASYYPAGALDTFGSFMQYTYQLRSRLEGQIMGDPVHQMFPGAVVGDFGAFQSSAAAPYVDIRGTLFPPRQLDSTDALIPNLYNQEVMLQLASPPAKASPKWADGVFVARWLRTYSSDAVNRGDKQLLPFVSSAIAGFWNSANLQFMMGRTAYREALRQLWLRGVNTMWLFTGGTDGLGTPEKAFQMMDDSRAVYDGLMAYGNFLTHGTPMNLASPDAAGTQPIWSGLKLGDQALVRTYAPSGKAGRVTIDAFPGVTVKLPAPPAGAGFLITSTGHVRRVKM